MRMQHSTATRFIWILLSNSCILRVYYPLFARSHAAVSERTQADTETYGADCLLQYIYIYAYKNTYKILNANGEHGEHGEQAVKQMNKQQR